MRPNENICVLQFKKSPFTIFGCRRYSIEETRMEQKTNTMPKRATYMYALVENGRHPLSLLLPHLCQFRFSKSASKIGKRNLVGWQRNTSNSHCLSLAARKKILAGYWIGDLPMGTLFVIDTLNNFRTRCGVRGPTE